MDIGIDREEQTAGFEDHSCKLPFSMSEVDEVQQHLLQEYRSSSLSAPISASCFFFLSQLLPLYGNGSSYIS
jgi:hypothetical protein